MCKVLMLLKFNRQFLVYLSIIESERYYIYSIRDKTN